MSRYSFPIWMWRRASPADRRVPWALRPGGHLLVVHWRHYAPDHPRAGDELYQILARDPRLAWLAGYRDPEFTAEVRTRAGGERRSVAQADGGV